MIRKYQQTLLNTKEIQLKQRNQGYLENTKQILLNQVNLKKIQQILGKSSSNYKKKSSRCLGNPLIKEEIQ